MLHAIFFLITGTVSLNVLDKHYQNMGGYTSAEQRASFPTFFLTNYPAVEEEKTNRICHIQIYGSKYNTCMYRWWNVQGPKGYLYIRDALQSQPTTHFCFWKWREFFRSIKRRNILCSNRHKHRKLWQRDHDFHLMRIRILNLINADAADPIFLCDNDPDTDLVYSVEFLKS